MPARLTTGAKVAALVLLVVLTGGLFSDGRDAAWSSTAALVRLVRYALGI
jgi:hypothetical protein